jgi:hypothetical protein
MRRTPTCHSCEKPLGGTEVYCYDCQSDDNVDTSDHDTSKDLETVKNWRRYWLQELGVHPKYIERYSIGG